MTDRLQDIIKYLRLHQYGFTVEDVLDSIWLSGYLEDSTEFIRTLTTAAEEEDETGKKESGGLQEEFGQQDEFTVEEEFKDKSPKKDIQIEEPIDEFADVYLPRSAGKEIQGKPIRIPSAPVISNKLELSRALRPFMQRIPSRSLYLIDEEKSAYRIADEGIWEPVLLPAPERWFQVELVMDVGASMDVWHNAGYELLDLLNWMGAFRNIKTWSLDADNLKPGLYPGFQGFFQGAQPRHPLELVDTGRRHLILILTDCVSTAWHTGGITGLLEHWAAKGPVAIIQVFPRYLWNRSALRNAEPVHFYSPFAASPNTQLKWKSTAIIPVKKKEKDIPGIPVPIVPFDLNSIGNWARLVTGTNIDSVVRGVIFRRESRDAFLQEAHFTTERSSSESLERFWMAASPLAGRLALLISASPSISLQVIRLIRTVLLPGATHVHEAEILLSGILKVVKDSDTDDFNPDDIQYEFRGNIRSELLDNLPARDSLNVLLVVSSYIEEHVGSTGSFRAILANPSKAVGKITVGDNPIAKITAAILRRLGGDYTRLIKKIPGKEKPKLKDEEETAKQIPDQAPTAPVQHLSKFIGRQDILNEIKETGDSHFIIAGMPKIGKTSLLNVLKEVLSDNSRCCYINILELLKGVDSYDSFESAFIKECMSQHPQKSASIKGASTSLRLRAMADYIRRPKRFCVLCLDDFVIATGFDSSDAEKFKIFFKEIFFMPNIRLMITYNKKESDTIKRYFEEIKWDITMPRKLNSTTLPVLSEEEVKKAARQQLKLNTGETGNLYRYVGGFPHLFHLYDKWDKDQKAIDDYSKDVALEFCDFIFDYFKELSPAGRALIYTCLYYNFVAERIPFAYLYKRFPFLLKLVPTATLKKALNEISEYEGFETAIDEESFSIDINGETLLFRKAAAHIPFMKVFVSINHFIENPNIKNANEFVLDFSKVIKTGFLPKSIFGKQEDKHYESLVDNYKDDFYVRLISDEGQRRLGMPAPTFLVILLKQWKEKETLIHFQDLYLTLQEYVRRVKISDSSRIFSFKFYILLFDFLGPGRDEVKKELLGLERIAIIDTFGIRDILLDSTSLRKTTQYIFKQMNIRERSPYTTAGVVEDTFFGREMEMALIRGLTDNIGVFGPRSIGKTSLLLKLYHDIKDRPGWKVYALDCSRIENDEALLKNLAEKMEVDFNRISNLEKFREYVLKKAEKENSQFLFLFDEVDRLLEYDTHNDEKIFRTFNRICTEPLKRGNTAARFILFGFHVMYKQMINQNSRLYNFMVFLPLKPLDMQSAFSLVTLPMRDIHIKWKNEERDANYLVDQCSGYPLLLQAACHALLTILDDKNVNIDIIEREDIDRALTSAEFRELLMRFYAPAVREIPKKKGLLGRSRKSAREEEKPFYEDIHKVTTLASVMLFIKNEKASFTLNEIREELMRYKIHISPSRMREIINRLCLIGTFRWIDESTIIASEYRSIPDQVKQSIPREVDNIKVDKPAIYSDSADSSIKSGYQFGIKIFPKILIANFGGIDYLVEELKQLAKGIIEK